MCSTVCDGTSAHCYAYQYQSELVSCAFSQSYNPYSYIENSRQLYRLLGGLTPTCPIEEVSIIHVYTCHSLVNRKYTESGRDCNLVVISSSFIIVIPPTGDEYGKLH